mmetsp:Transcript_27883/g.86841  ORF Transcript_27883/g.86841 Transcript_27883/m.86841 type:complete len:392 (+) Transcript_27883:102-1277(+)
MDVGMEAERLLYVRAYCRNSVTEFVAPGHVGLKFVRKDILVIWVAHVQESASHGRRLLLCQRLEMVLNSAPIGGVRGVQPMGHLVMERLGVLAGADDVKVGVSRPAPGPGPLDGSHQSLLAGLQLSKGPAPKGVEDAGGQVEARPPEVKVEGAPAGLDPGPQLGAGARPAPNLRVRVLVELLWPHEEAGAEEAGVGVHAEHAGQDLCHPQELPVRFGVPLRPAELVEEKAKRLPGRGSAARHRQVPDLRAPEDLQDALADLQGRTGEGPRHRGGLLGYALGFIRGQGGYPNAAALLPETKLGVEAGRVQLRHRELGSEVRVGGLPRHSNPATAVVACKELRGVVSKLRGLLPPNIRIQELWIPVAEWANLVKQITAVLADRTARHWLLQGL